MVEFDFPSVMIFLVAVLILSVAYQQTTITNNNEIQQTNYNGLVKLKLAPNSPPRIATSNDINTGIKFSDGKNVYTMYESREIAKGDLGKTFIGING